MRVIVCGGRKYEDRARVWAALDGAGITRLAHGGATGADEHARAWAITRGVVNAAYPAAWAVLGRKAGPLRNAIMLASEQPDLVIAFRGGAGTADMVRRAKAAGVPVREEG